MLDLARRDNQAVHSGSIEHEAKGCLGHALLPFPGIPSQLFDSVESVRARISDAGLRSSDETAAGWRNLASAILAGQEPAGKRAEGGVAKSMVRAVGDERVGIGGHEA